MHYRHAISLLIGIFMCGSNRAQESNVMITRAGLPDIVLLGQSRASVELLLGRSDTYRCESGYTSVKEDRRHTSKTVIKSWDGVQKYRSFYGSRQIYVNYSVRGRMQHVRSIEVIGREYITDKGVSVGSQLEQVVEAYGPLHNGQADYRHDGLAFIIEDDKVERIMVYPPE